jgi:hypothetical protein
MPKLDRVIVSRMMVGICHMQVCAVKSATNKEILEVCNRDNPTGISSRWGKVLRKGTRDLKTAPVPCEKYPSRTHFLVSC